MEDNRLPKQLMFGELASGKQKQGRPLKRIKDCVKATISHAEITPKELEPRPHDRTGWRALPDSATVESETRSKGTQTVATIDCHILIHQTHKHTDTCTNPNI